MQGEGVTRSAKKRKKRKKKKAKKSKLFTSCKNEDLALIKEHDST